MAVKFMTKKSKYQQTISLFNGTN